MNFKNVWTITTKDIGLFIKKKSILITALILPFAISIGLPSLIGYLINDKGRPVQLLLPVIDAFGFFFVILSALIPTFIASYSFVGEKTEKSLEPLLATPTSDYEILLGKSLAAFLPVISMIFIGATIFMTLMDFVTGDALGYLYFPNENMGLIILLSSPLTCIASIELSIIISSRINDVRSAQQLAVVAMIPFFLIYVLTEVSVITLDTDTLLMIAGIIALIDVGLFLLSRAVFQREEILTKWK